VELFNYEQLKVLNGLGGSVAVFPERQAGSGTENK
jgi:hypothetical protein